MGLRVVWRRRAIQDVTNIVTYIAQSNPYAAAVMAARLDTAAAGLRTFPNRGRPGQEPGTRELTVVAPYVIIYRLSADAEVEIVRVWHAAQSRQAN